MRWRLKTGDEVLVTTGSSKGHRGKIVSVLRKEERVFVLGANLKARHTKPSVQYPDGGIIRKEASIHVSNVMLVDPNAIEAEGIKGATRLGMRMTSDGKKVRYGKRSGKEV